MANALAASMAGLSMHCHCRASTPRPSPSFGFSCSMRGQGLSIRGMTSSRPTLPTICDVSQPSQLCSQAPVADECPSQKRAPRRNSTPLRVQTLLSCRNRQMSAFLQQVVTGHSSSPERQAEAEIG